VTKEQPALAAPVHWWFTDSAVPLALTPEGVVRLVLITELELEVNVIGIDIGYSSLKLAAGNAAQTPRPLLRPAWAAPADRFGSRFDERAQDDFLHPIDPARICLNLVTMAKSGIQTRHQA
jgi:hypothetical protein